MRLAANVAAAAAPRYDETPAVAAAASDSSVFAVVASLFSDKLVPRARVLLVVSFVDLLVAWFVAAWNDLVFPRFADWLAVARNYLGVAQISAFVEAALIQEAPTFSS